MATRAWARTSPTTRSTTSRCRTPGRCSRWPARGRSTRSPQHLGELDLWPAPPVREPSIDYRRWAYESAALDLALRQAGTILAEAWARAAARSPSSCRCGSASPTSRDDRAGARGSSCYPTLRFKLDPTNDVDRRADRTSWWTRARSTRSTSRASTRARPSTSRPTRSCTAAGRGVPGRLARGPGPRRAETRRGARAEHDRITWDAPIHSVADIEALPFPPKMVNIKPSRFGPLTRAVRRPTTTASARASAPTAAGSSSSGAGRGHIQYLASLFHPDTPNDVAPGGTTCRTRPTGLPTSPARAADRPARLPLARIGIGTASLNSRSSEGAARVGPPARARTA